ncbi:GL15834 [Drosophila persimilis]|uniref:Uncharacterized protein n=2 Tax=pseudoobscura subgroup TaxID=32358 RepID=A0A6I8VPI7_DROPS|nr:uncharacterized protein LOC117183358 [Drosophila pseudoobscura]EDW30851.1 GL15834 [Drosophila persimilis]
MSGLTRWQFIFGEVEVDTDQEFGDYHTTAIDETRYKSAILQHPEDRTESFVYSVKHYNDPMEDSDLEVTTSHAIFPRDGLSVLPHPHVGAILQHRRPGSGRSGSPEHFGRSNFEGVLDPPLHKFKKLPLWRAAMSFLIAPFSNFYYIFFETT